MLVFQVGGGAMCCSFSVATWVLIHKTVAEVKFSRPLRSSNKATKARVAPAPASQLRTLALVALLLCVRHFSLARHIFAFSEPSRESAAGGEINSAQSRIDSDRSITIATFSLGDYAGMSRFCPNTPRAGPRGCLVFRCWMFVAGCGAKRKGAFCANHKPKSGS
jgi:hypothetical protein